MKIPSPAYVPLYQFFDPSAEDKALFAKHAAGGNGKGGMGAGSEVSLEQLLKVSDEPKVTKEEENTFIMQVRMGTGNAPDFHNYSYSILLISMHPKHSYDSHFGCTCKL